MHAMGQPLKVIQSLNLATSPTLEPNKFSMGPGKIPKIGARLASRHSEDTVYCQTV